MMKLDAGDSIIPAKKEIPAKSAARFFSSTGRSELSQRGINVFSPIYKDAFF